MEENNKKTISFGFSDDKNPAGSWEGIGINRGLLLTDAEYYGIVRCGSDNFLVAKVTEDEYNRYPNLLNKFIVRRALADFYKDGSSTLFLDQTTTFFTSRLEDLLNSDKIKDSINNTDDIIKLVDGINNPERIYSLIGLDDRIMATSIKHEEFNAKQQKIENARESIVGMQNTIDELKAELEKARSSSRTM